jgi:hypothetical protein
LLLSILLQELGSGKTIERSLCQMYVALGSDFAYAIAETCHGLAQLLKSVK